MLIYDKKKNCWISHRDTSEYKLRKHQLRNYWTIGLPTILPFTPAIQITLLMLALFISLSYLDETPYRL